MKLQRAIVFWLLITLLATFLTWTLSPVHSQAPTFQIVESDASQVIREGNWVSQSTSGASGGSYLYNGGPAGSANPDAVLQLAFSGTTIEIIYTSGPNMGMLAVEVDGTVLRTVMTTSPTVQFGQSTRLDYLTDEPHTVRVYAQSGGVVGIDAFIISSLAPIPSNGGLSSGSTRFTTDLTAIAVTDSRIDIFWTETLPDEIEFIVERSPNGFDNWLEIGRIPTNNTFVANINLPCGMTYYYRGYAALMGGGFSPYSNVATASTSPCLPNCNPNDAVRRVSVQSDGRQARDESHNPVLSSDGRYVAFWTLSQLVPLDTNTSGDVYYYDLDTCQIQLVSVTSDGLQGSGHGSYPDISGDGRFVVFHYAGGALAPQDTNGFLDVYLRDMQTHTTTLLSMSPDGVVGNANSQLPKISADGRYIFFSSDATNLVPPYPGTMIFDRQTEQLTSIQSSVTDISGDGSRILRTGSNYVSILEWQTPRVIQVYSTPNNGINSATGASISANGRYVLFQGAGPDFDQIGLFTVYRYDVDTGERLRISALNGQSEVRSRSVSADGRYSLFFSNNPFNTDGEDTNREYDFYVYDAQTGERRIVSLNAAGELSNGSSGSGVISDDGNVVAFVSLASNLIPRDTNGTTDIFVVNLALLPRRFQLNAVATGQTSTHLDWVDDNTGESTWVVERSPNGLDQWTIIANLPANTTTYEDTSLHCSTRYYYRVRAYSSSSATFATYSIVAAANTEWCVRCDAQNLIHRVSIATGDYEGNWGSPRTSYALPSEISGDGRLVVFESEATNLVPNDTNGVADIFLHDRATCTTTRISQLSDGTQPNGRSEMPTITPDGRYIVFESWADNLFPNDTNDQPDVFLYDRQLDELSHVSPAPPGEPFWGGYEADISADGRFVVYNFGHIYVYDRQTDTTERITRPLSGVGEGGLNPSISEDGRLVAFRSFDNNLVANDTNSRTDIFVYDRQTQQTQLVSVSSAGVQSDDDSFYPRISGNGRYVVFQSRATNLVPNDTTYSDIFLHDLQTHTTEQVSFDPQGQLYPDFAGYPDISADGRYVTFVVSAVVVYDRQRHQSHEVSVSPMGAWGTGFYPRISNDGNYVVFGSGTDNLVAGDFNSAQDIFVASVQQRPQVLVLTVNNTTRTQVSLSWTGSYPLASHVVIQRRRYAGWETITSLPSNQVSFVDSGVGCSRLYTYRIQAYWSLAGLSSPYSATVSAQTQPCLPHVLALFRSDLNVTSQLNTLQDAPPFSAYNTFTLNPPPVGDNGKWVMGDWNGDGLKTPGMYATNGVFYITNQSGGTGSTWIGTWFGLYGRPPVVGRFSNLPNDCLGVMDSAYLPPYGTAFALYFTCNMNGGAPPLSFQWISVVLPDPLFSGIHQFAAGDFDGDGLDSIAVRRGAYIAFTNVAPSMGHAAYNLAQYWGVPPDTAGDEGVFVVGDWNLNGLDSFGVFYQNGYFYRRDDLQWNTGIYTLQRIGHPIGAPVTATSWQPQ